MDRDIDNGWIMGEIWREGRDQQPKKERGVTRTIPHSSSWSAFSFDSARPGPACHVVVHVDVYYSSNNFKQVGFAEN